MEVVLPTSHHGSQLSKLQEVSSENPSNSSVSNTNHQMKQESVENEAFYTKQDKAEVQPLYNAPHAVTGHKENQNPNSYSLENENNVCNQQKLLSKDSIKPNKPYADSNLKLEYNIQNPPRKIDSFKDHQIKDSQNVHPRVTQAEQLTIRPRPIQTNVTSFPKLNRVITVNNSQYLVLGKLGQGMSGEVLWVYDLGTSQSRAIKCVNLSKMDKDAAKGCLQEIVMLDKLKAPCIVHMYS